MNQHQQLAGYLLANRNNVHNVVDFNPAEDRLLQLDFTERNTELLAEDIADTAIFSKWVDDKLAQNNCRYGVGGYMEHRTLYARSALFNTTGQEPRRLHLGVDIWGAAGTPVYAPLQGTVHSFQDNDHFGDYGPTIILQHNLDGLSLYSLYGHLNKACLAGLEVGETINGGQQIATLGAAHENGNWPPHLHFQLIFDTQGKAGDYPGVAPYSQKDIWLQNIPDPDIILQFSKATII